MDTRNLITFTTFAKEGSYLKTSMKLNYAPSTLTEHIAQLERELGVKLIETVGRKAVLTKEGKTFLPFARNILDSVQIAKDAVDNTQALKGTITIGAVESMAAYRLEPVFTEFLSHNPNVNLVIKSGNSASLPVRLLNNEFDVVFLYDCTTQNYPGLHETLLFQEELRFCVSPRHRLAAKSEVCPTDLKYETFLYQHEDCCYYDAFRELIQKEQMKIHDSLQIESGSLIKKCVMKERGISVLPRSMTEEEVLEEKLVYLNWKGDQMLINGKMLTPKNRWKSAATEAFLKFAHEYTY